MRRLKLEMLLPSRAVIRTILLCSILGQAWSQTHDRVSLPVQHDHESSPDLAGSRCRRYTKTLFAVIDAGIGSTWLVTPASSKPKGLYYKNINNAKCTELFVFIDARIGSTCLVSLLGASLRACTKDS